MTWARFYYAFDRRVQNSLRYSIEEAIRRQAQSVTGATSKGIADDAVDTFMRKMEKALGHPVKFHDEHGYRET